jgi:hypothetical protein
MKARRKKSVKRSVFVLFPPPTLDAWFQSPKLLGRGKSNGLALDVQYSMLNIDRGGKTEAET